MVGVALRHGRGPAALASVLSVGAFDFFFVPPRLSFAVSDVQYLLTFIVLLTVGLVIGQLTAGLREQASVAVRRETDARTLYELARELSAALDHAADRGDWRTLPACRVRRPCVVLPRLGVGPPASGGGCQ